MLLLLLVVDNGNDVDVTAINQVINTTLHSFSVKFHAFACMNLYSYLFLGTKRTTSTVVLILCSRHIPAATSFCGVARPLERRLITTLRMASQASNHKPITTGEKITILGFGSLLSERSSRTTFPDLEGFRIGRVPNYRRVFGHPASIFFQRGIANLETKEISSLSAEFCEGHKGFICSVFEVPSGDMMKDGIPSAAFLEREEEFNIVTGIEYLSLENPDMKGDGILCTASSDVAYLSRWGEVRFEQQYKKYGVDTIWGWGRDSGLRPCAVYLRHCYLAAKSMGEECFNSFLDETFLVDRQTTVREYILNHPEVLETQPPKELVGRYSG